MRARNKSLWLLGLFMVLDILPIPVLALALIYVVIERPPWFRELVERLYRE